MSAIQEQKACVQKVWYRSKEAALRAYDTYYESSVQLKRGRRFKFDKTKQIPYKCRYCNGWHLSRMQ